MRLSFIALLFLAATGLLSCQDEIEMPRPEMERLIGTWRLYQVHSSWSGIYNTDTTGQQVVLKFRKNGIFTQKNLEGLHTPLSTRLKFQNLTKTNLIISS